jgi:hypothetical protein
MTRVKIKNIKILKFFFCTEESSAGYVLLQASAVGNITATTFYLSNVFS